MTDMNDFNQDVIKQFRANGGKVGPPFEGAPMLLLTTTGARSGEPRTAVVGYRKSGDIFVVIASDNGAAADPAWYVNLLANPNATVEVGPEKLNVRARTVKGKERDKLAKLVEYLEPQQKLTARKIPVVALERAKS